MTTKTVAILALLIDFSFVGNKVVCHFDTGYNYEVYVDLSDKNTVDAVYKECKDMESKLSKGES